MHLFYKLAPVRILATQHKSSAVLIQFVDRNVFWVDRAELEERRDPDWSLLAPTRAGTYRWRKSFSWEPVERVVTVAPASSEYAGQLVTFAHRYGHEVPLNRLEAGGSEWCGADLLSGGR